MEDLILWIQDLERTSRSKPEEHKATAQAVIRKSLQELKCAMSRHQQAGERGDLSIIPEQPIPDLTIYDIQQKSKLEISSTSLLSAEGTGSLAM